MVAHCTIETADLFGRYNIFLSVLCCELSKRGKSKEDVFFVLSCFTYVQLETDPVKRLDFGRRWTLEGQRRKESKTE